MSDSNRESSGYKIEAAWGVAESGIKQLLPLTGNTLSQSNETTTSAIIRSDTNVSGNVRTGVSVGGDLSIELNYGAYDDFFRGAMRSDWETALNVTGTDISFSVNTITSVASVFGSVSIGQYVRISGSVSNDAYRRVISSTATTLVVAGAAFTAESAGASITIKGQHMKNSTTELSYSVERNFEDITQYLLFYGLRLGGMQLTFATADITKGSITLLGKGLNSSTSSAFGTATPVVTTESANTVNNIKDVLIDDASFTGDITNFDFSISTNSDVQKKVGALENRGIRQGYMQVSGNLGVYFEDATLLAKQIAYEKTRIALVIEDDDGNAYVFEKPVCRFNTAPVDNGGVNGEITLVMGYDCELDKTLGYSMAITRISA